MPTRNSLELLAVAGQPLLANADSLVAADEESRILERIVSARRPAALRRNRRRAALTLVAAVTVALAVAIGAVLIGRDGSQNGLTGATIQVAGYRFKTPAGFERSSAPCHLATNWGGGTVGVDPYSEAGAADGGCVGAWGAENPVIPASADPVNVGPYQGYIAHGSPTAATMLYVYAPGTHPDTAYLVLVAQGLTDEQLVAIAESGLGPNS